MYKVYFLFGLVIFFLIDNGLALKCYTCSGKSCVHINKNTNVTSCDYLDKNITKTISNENDTLYKNTNVTCIHVKYRLIDDIEQADRFCSNVSCSVIEAWPQYGIGSECKQCKTNLCNKNLGVNFQSWSLSILVVITVFKIIFC